MLLLKVKAFNNNRLCYVSRSLFWNCCSFYPELKQLKNGCRIISLTKENLLFSDWPVRSNLFGSYTVLITRNGGKSCSLDS